MEHEINMSKAFTKALELQLEEEGKHVTEGF